NQHLLKTFRSQILPHREIWPLKITGKIPFFAQKTVPKRRSEVFSLTRWLADSNRRGCKK
ncbi:MAG: hypothetical protein WCA89_07685, partial [Terracidiphilus sp.]